MPVMIVTAGGLAQLVERSLSIVSNLRKVACSTHAVSTVKLCFHVFPPSFAAYLYLFLVVLEASERPLLILGLCNKC